MFSIIIPIYNKAAYIKKAVDSVLNQSLQEFELIIIDDGSTDNSLQIIRQYDDKRIKIVTQPNAGVSSARNHGARIARYDYLTFLDADDWWDLHFLEKMKMLISAYPDAGIFSSSYYKVKNGNNIRANIGVSTSFTDGYIDYCDVYARTLWMPVWTGSTIIPRSVFEQEQGFKAKLKLGEDFDLWIRIALKNRVAYLNKPLAYYNQDVEILYRAVTSERLYSTQEHYIFNLGYLSEEEKNNPTLKHLLDTLRVYVLFPYYLDTSRRNEAKTELEKVNWEKQPQAVRSKYHKPAFILKMYRAFMKLGSKVKQQIIKIRR